MSDESIPASSNEAEKSDAEFQRLIVRSVRRADCEAMAAAAARAGKTQGEWLGEAIRAYVAAERTDVVAYGELEAPGRHLPALAPAIPAPLGIEEIGRAVDVAVKIAELRGISLARRSRILVQAQRALAARLR